MCNDKEHAHDTCCGNHEHAHSHSHNHAHPHADAAPHSAEDTVKLLTYMLDHNRHHGDDLHEIFHALEAIGQADAATLVHDAMHQFDHGNNKLEAALNLLGGK